MGKVVNLADFRTQKKMDNLTKAMDSLEGLIAKPTSDLDLSNLVSMLNKDSIKSEKSMLSASVDNRIGRGLTNSTLMITATREQITEVARLLQDSSTIRNNMPGIFDTRGREAAVIESMRLHARAIELGEKYGIEITKTDYGFELFIK